MMSQRKSEQRTEQKDVKKTERRTEIGMVEVEALTNIAYGFPLKYADNKTKAILTEKYVKAGIIDDISHIDFFIPRCLSPIANNDAVYIWHGGFVGNQGNGGAGR